MLCFFCALQALSQVPIRSGKPQVKSSPPILCQQGTQSEFSGWVTSNVPSITTMFLAVAIHNSGAGVGSLISQWIWLDSEADIGYPTGNSVCAGCSAGVVCTAIGLRLYYGHLNKKGVKDVSGKERVWLL
jgi:hypothetical protein